MVQSILDSAEWARDRFLEMLGGRGASPDAYAILAEITASSQTLIDQLVAATSRETLPVRKAQEIVNANHAHKYREAAEMFEYALSDNEPKSHQ